MSDIIHQMIDLIQEQIPAASREILRKIEHDLRQQFGGIEAYIAKTELVEQKRRLINQELIAGLSITQIEHLHGIPRRTIYRIINQKPREH